MTNIDVTNLLFQLAWRSDQAVITTCDDYVMFLITVSVKHALLGSISFRNSKSGTGEESLLLFCRARARVKGMFFHRHPKHTHTHVSSILYIYIYIYIYACVCIYIYIYNSTIFIVSYIMQHPILFDVSCVSDRKIQQYAESTRP